MKGKGDAEFFSGETPDSDLAGYRIAEYRISVVLINSISGSPAGRYDFIRLNDVLIIIMIIILYFVKYIAEYTQKYQQKLN